ncbi:hypothetical protein QUC31_013169 [Theobroma cacao]|uniref:Transcription factor CPC n=2 Tax=Theobroma cacao TaxID=3641 RepID=A0AB32V169_THECC|nr:PREDICTED: transcription factor CPC [Theobroma cacao]EOY28699.1 Uncharacterized protein TCM_030224 [Theobroma cacao]
MGDLDRSSSGRGRRQDTKEERTDQDTKVEFSEDEEMLIARMFNLIGDRWSLIAGRIPGRTADEIEKYWTSRRSSQSTHNQR